MYWKLSVVSCLDVQIRICHIEYAWTIFIHSFIHSTEFGTFMLFCHFLKEVMPWSKNIYEKQGNLFGKMKFYKIALLTCRYPKVPFFSTVTCIKKKEKGREQNLWFLVIKTTILSGVTICFFAFFVYFFYKGAKWTPKWPFYSTFYSTLKVTVRYFF